MIDRIKKLMDYKKLSATQFSDEIEIQRSSLSHVLSGRNKPSLDFMLKIKNTYPEIELDWLLLGKGNMISKTDVSDHFVETIETEKNIEPQIDFGVHEETTSPSKEVVEPLKRQTTGVIDKNNGEQPVRVLLFYPDNTFESYETK